MRRYLTPGRLAALALVLLAAVVGVLLLAPSDHYLFLPNQARPVAPLVEVPERLQRDGGPEGGLYFVDILVRRASLLERLVPGIREGASLVPEHAVNPTGLSDPERRRTTLREMTRSQKIAAAVALRSLGYEVQAEPAGALVTAVAPDAPAAAELEPTDVIVAVGGEPVGTPAELRRLLEGAEPGERVALTVRRGEERIELDVETRESPDDPRRAILGILVEQAADIELPVDISIDAGNVGGPSAGLAFALDVVDELGREIDRGRTIAVTGEIELDGDVAPVGGLKQKTIGARRAGADIFVVPAGDNAAEARRYADGLRIVPVRNFQQALQALTTDAQS